MIMPMSLNILYVDRLPLKQEIGSYKHIKCPTLTLVAYPNLDAQVCTKYLKCHTNLFVLNCHVYYFYLFWCKRLKKAIFGGQITRVIPTGGYGSPRNYPKICSSPPSGKIIFSVEPHCNKFLYPRPNVNPPTK